MEALNGHLPTIIQGVFGVGIVGFVWKIASDNAKTTSTIFKRFDDYKQSVKQEHVTKDVCDLVRTQLGDDIKEIKEDVKELVRAKRNGG